MSHITLFCDVETTFISFQQLAPMSDLFDPLPLSSRESLNWVPDNEVQSCMTCHKGFSVITRKHHCRKCGQVVCADCSPNKKKLSISDLHAVRVCNPCYTSVEEHCYAHEWPSVHSTDEASIADPVIEGRVYIGQLHVKIVEAIGLPSSDAITSDPYVRLTFTGKARHGQEWSPELRSTRHTKYKNRTLNPHWDESFVFNVFAPGAELKMEVFNYGQLSRPTKLGEATIALSQLMDQRRHNKWMDLSVAPKFKHVGQNEARAGRIHVLLHYKFSRTAEFFSHFTEEQPFVYEWPKFKAAQLYSNFWVLLDILWIYLEMIWQIPPTLNWEKPTRTVMWFLICIWMCLYIQWVPVVFHIVLIGITVRNYFDLAIKGHAQDPTRVLDPTDSEGLGQSQTPLIYSLPPGLHHITNKMTHATMDTETKAALQNVQNYMKWWSEVIRNIERMFSWENVIYTTTILIILILSCLLHIAVPNQYLLLVLVFYLFTMWTIPYLSLVRCLRGFGEAIRSLIHQHRLTVISDQKMKKSMTLVHNEGKLRVNAEKWNCPTSSNIFTTTNALSKRIVG